MDEHVINIAERDEIPSLQTPVQFLPGVGPARAPLLERLELKTAEDRTVFWRSIERIDFIPRRSFVYLSAMSAHVIPENSVVEGNDQAFANELQRRWQHASGSS